MQKLLRGLLASICLTSGLNAQSEQLVVHEWETFTTLQDPTGRELGAINEDAEALPAFVKNLIPSERGIKGFPTHPAVTMRLETPVVYFHLPKGASPMKLDYSASFNGGLLTQYYPDAQNNYDQTQSDKFGKESVTGMLTWKNITIGKPQAGPETTSNVWLAPRKVDAADVINDKGEAERYLFYRGVGNLRSPIYVRTDSSNLYIHHVLGNSFATANELMIPQFWYIDIQNNELQYQTVYNFDAMPHSGRMREPSDPIAKSPLGFPGDQVRTLGYDAHKQLQTEIKKELIKQGIFEDEAQAMLNTWEQSYFKSPGKRVLYIVPKKWVDFYLPVKINVPAKIERVMIGRVDLVTQEQIDEAKGYLKKVKPQIDPAMPLPAAQSMMQSMTAMPPEPLPKLGRFTNAILWDTYRRGMLGVDSSIKP